jgi:hypothetical protein
MLNRHFLYEFQCFWKKKVIAHVLIFRNSSYITQGSFTHYLFCLHCCSCTLCQISCKTCIFAYFRFFIKKHTADITSITMTARCLYTRCSFTSCLNLYVLFHSIMYTDLYSILKQCASLCFFLFFTGYFYDRVGG